MVDLDAHDLNPQHLHGGGADLSRYRVTFRANGTPDAVAILGDPVQIIDGYGGWTVVSRQRRIGLTQWQGKDPLRMAVPVLFDGVRDSIGQELAISHLSRMALPPQAGGEPPVVTVDGRGVPDSGIDQWVIERLQWGQNVLWDFERGGTMARLRQDCVVNLLEYRGDDRVAFKNIQLGLQPGKSKSGWPKTYVSKEGDTLKKIAAKKEIYGDASKWSKIANANKIRDPRTLRPNTKLTIPAP